MKCVLQLKLLFVFFYKKVIVIVEMGKNVKIIALTEEERNIMWTLA